ncbi:hypothetical protein DX928_04675 [Bacillus swezeyi]|uniref:Uncharacterized protein n=1 Tax=Bacillus swezeyi TaxID=1925020 RepID=A0A5M8RUI0_9BACI|nr:hypothetical protein DX927_12620 [Bacillus swezeyi]KAA6482387.1 hypothetical protein DX928_04675 [Bacillus swezeyi]
MFRQGAPSGRKTPPTAQEKDLRIKRTLFFLYYRSDGFIDVKVSECQPQCGFKGFKSGAFRCRLMGQARKALSMP